MSDAQLTILKRKLFNAAVAFGPLLVLLTALQTTLPRWAQALLAGLSATCLWITRNWTSAADVRAEAKQ